MIRKLSRLVLLFVLSVLIVVPVQAKASGDDILAHLPYDQPVHHHLGYSDFKGKAALLVFSNIGWEITSHYLSLLDRSISTYGIGDQLPILYFDVWLDGTELEKRIDGQKWRHVFAYSGGSEKMWELLWERNIDSIYFPAVFFVSESGEVKGFAHGEEIDSALPGHLGKIVDLAKVSENAEYKVLADVAEPNRAARKAEIYERWQAIDPKARVSYDILPKAEAPYAAGAVKQSYLENALRTLNLVRYLSGLPDVTLNSEYIAYAQHGAVLMKASGYGHTPAQPADMSDAFYETGFKGTSRGNIYYGYANLYSGIIHGWLADDDRSNIDRVGHRRWALNPEMGSTGFGEANGFGVMYVLDRSAPVIGYDAIAYPSGSVFPSELFRGSYPWSVSLNPLVFETPDPDKVTVTLSGGGKTYTFSKAKSSFSGDYFNIDTGGYGIANSIIFRPSGIQQYEGTYKVKIDGLTNVFGRDVSLSYETTFYQISPDDRFGKPSPWAEHEVNRAMKLQLLPDSLADRYQAPITRAEFSRLAVTLYEKLKGPMQATATFRDTDDLNVRKMATLGIVSGIGNGFFNPDADITREQAAKMLDLLLVELGEPANPQPVTYADQKDISAWARDYVNSVSNRGIMGSAGGNQFTPQGTFTREQSIVTMVRIYDLFSK